MVQSLTNQASFREQVGTVSQLRKEHVQEIEVNQRPQISELSKDNPPDNPPESSIPELEAQAPASDEYTNKSFEKIFNILKPIINLISKNQIKLSMFGSVTHGLDAFVRVTGIGKSLENKVSDLSMWWSKAINPLGAILKGFESLAKNDLVDALTKFSLIAKLGVKVAPNLGIPLGLYLANMMSLLTAQNSGLVPNVKKSFNSMTESVTYYKDVYKKFLGGVIDKIKNEKSPGARLENLGILYGYPVLAISSLIGTFTMKDQINTPWARMIGFFRNSSGGLCDITFVAQRIRKLKEMAQGKGLEKPTLKEILKDPQMSFMAKYLANSILDLTMRIWKDPRLGIIQAQISNSIYEIANAESSQGHAEEEKPTDKIKTLAEKERRAA